MSAFENSLRSSVSPVDMTTSGAFPGGISGVNMIHFDGLGVGLISQKLLKLEEAPGVDLAVLAFSPLGSLADVLEVFEDDDAVFRERLYDLLRNAVVHVTPEAVLLGSHLLKVSFGGLGTTLLKLSSQALIAMGGSRLVVESVVGTDCYLVNSTVDTEDGWVSRIFEFRDIFLENDTEEDLALAEGELCGSPSPGYVLLIIVWEVERGSEPAVYGEDRNFTPVKPDAEASPGITDGRPFATRTSSILLDSGFKCLGGLHPGLDSEVCRESESGSNMFVGLMMQGYGIVILILISNFTDVIESTSHCLKRGPDLFRRYRQLDPGGACQCFHVHKILILLTMSTPLLPRLKPRVSVA